MEADKKKIVASPGIKVAFLGDISLNDKYLDLHKQGVNPFEDIEKDLKRADYTVGNLECMARGNEGENHLKSPRLSTTVETLHYLKYLNLSVATLAHNHVYDHLSDGFVKTTSKLEEIGIQYVGAGITKEQASEPIILSKNGIKLGLLNYVTRDTNPNLAEDARVYLNFFDEEKVKTDIRKLRKKADHVILQLHWGGNVEGGYYPDWDQPKLARRLVDMGADLIIGHHSHTLQPFEVYRGKYIFYSLGNFCFADIYFEDKIIEIERGRHTESAIVQVQFSVSDYSIEFIMIENVKNRITVNNLLEKKWLKRNRVFSRFMETKIIWNTYHWKLKHLNPVLFFLFGNNRNILKQMKKMNTQKARKHIAKLFSE